MLSIIGSIFKFSLTISSLILIYFLGREVFFILLRKFYIFKNKYNPIVKNNLIWDMYNNKKLKYILTDFEYAMCLSFDRRLNLLYDTINSNKINEEEKHEISKHIEKDLLQLKTLNDIYLLDKKVKNILSTYN